MNWHFRTLGMGSFNYRSAATRLANEAEQTGLFVSSFGMSERYLRRFMPEFWQDHRNVMSPRVPGYGWWVWKPYFILNELLSIPEGDGLLYLDAGSVINNDPESLDQIKGFLNIASKEKLLGSNSDYYKESLYCSTDMMDFFQLSPGKRQESQYCAAILFVVNDSIGRDFLRKWCESVCVNDHNGLLPRFFVKENAEGFKHHMHDQASFSCLMKIFTRFSIPTGTKDIDGAIRLARHRYGYGLYETRSRVIITFKLLSTVNKYYLALMRRINRSSLTARPKSHQIRIP